MLPFKLKLFTLSLLVIAIVTFLTLYSDRSATKLYKPGINPTNDSAVNQAKEVYKEKKELGIDLANGPCLSNDLLPGWVLDIAHNPRTPEDDQPENQCRAYAEGRAKHFVEMDEDGNVLKVR